MPIFKLVPAFKDYIWGGKKLVTDYNKEYDGSVLAESWELSCHPDGLSVITNGDFKGITLKQYIEQTGRAALGNDCSRFEEFPILIKFIDARERLSIQVHPNNQYALTHEGQYGKTEMWYIADCKKDAFLYYGFSREIGLTEFRRRIEENTLLEVLNAVPVQTGDVLFIEAGTIHAIGEGIVIAEIQQNSNLTYRVYDYGRIGKDGKQRDLDIEKALAVTNRIPIIRSKNCTPHIASCDYFTVDKLNLDGTLMKKMNGNVSDNSFLSILFLEGSGMIRTEEAAMQFRKGDSFFLTAGSGEYEVCGDCEALMTSVGKREGVIHVK